MGGAFADILTRFTGAVEAGDGRRLAELFTPDGVYTDTFYGAFAGRRAIRDMLESFFHRDGARFLWDMFDPVYQGGTGYARWVFSYTSRMEDSAGNRVVFDGMSRFEIAEGLIRRYDEIFSAGIAFVQLDMAPARIEKILRRLADDIRKRPESARHITGG